MEEDQIANFVLAYLKKKGFKEAEQAFLEELRLDKTNSSSSFSIDLDSAKQLLAVPENKMCDRNGKWEESSEGESNYEMHDLDSNDEDECYYAPELAPKLQFRKYVSTVCWNEKMEMAEVLENKGRLWTTTGIVRCGKIYCSVEETLFLMEIGAIMLLNDGKGCISLKDLYGKVAGGKNGCTWEQFEVYKHLKSLGYIVGRHGVPWSVKKVKNCGDSVPSQSSGDKNEILVEESKNMDSINLMFNEMQIGGTRPMFDVYPPNSKFRKSSPGDPSFIICFAREHPPCKEEIEELERQCGRVPLKFSVVEHGRVSIFAFEEERKTSLILSFARSRFSLDSLSNRAVASSGSQGLSRRKPTSSSSSPPSGSSAGHTRIVYRSSVSQHSDFPFWQRNWFIGSLFVMALAFFALAVFLYFGLDLDDASVSSASAVSPEGVDITYGTVLKLMHEKTKFRLHSHDVPYGSGSGQQSVTGFRNVDDSNSYWIVKPEPGSSGKQGDTITSGTIIRLQHMRTRKWLHSHLHASPISGNLEVSCYGGENESDTGDYWRLLIEGTGKTWKQDQKVRLQHVDTNGYLHSHDKKYTRIAGGQQEVCGVREKGADNIWLAAEGVYLPTVESK